jgi:hypothetical protein
MTLVRPVRERRLETSAELGLFSTTGAPGTHRFAQAEEVDMTEHGGPVLLTREHKGPSVMGLVGMPGELLGVGVEVSPLAHQEVGHPHSLSTGLEFGA